MQKATFSLTHEGEATYIILKGVWRSRFLHKAINLHKVKIYSQNKVFICFKNIESLDTAGAILIQKLIDTLEKEKISFEYQDINNRDMSVIKSISSIDIEEKNNKNYNLFDFFYIFLAYIGKSIFKTGQTSILFLSFMGEALVYVAKSIFNPRRIRWEALFSILQRVGLHALPIIGLISFLVGIVLSYQSIEQLKRFGVEIFTIDLLAISVLREVGILLTSIVIAGRSGSAFTAQIGFMKLNQELDAMTVLSMDPFEVLILPRLFALLIALPLLTFFANMMALLGGAFMTTILLEISFEQFIMHLKGVLTLKTFWVGMVKTPFFASAIALTACFEGLRVQGGARNVGIHTTKSVVESIFLVIILDAAFSILFSMMKI